jgi:photosystem II stability/assembly factor-like uncharacterized protein
MREKRPVPQDYAILVGTVGNGMYRSADSGDSFHWVSKGLSCNDTVFRGFAVDPANPHHVIVGTAIFETPYPAALGTPFGLHESFDSGATWAPIEHFRGIECWRIVFAPNNPKRYYVGTRPANIYRTDDGGKTFEKLPTPFPQSCIGIGLPRITSIVLHPEDPDYIFVSIEIGGFYRSLDGGRTWEQVLNDLSTPFPNGNLYGEQGRIDGHHSGLSLGSPNLLLASTPDGIYVSSDLGKTWTDCPVPQVFAGQYHHDLTIKVNDPNTIYYGVGDDTVGTQGALLRTRDRGASWDVAKFPEECNSPIWCFAQHPSNPDRILAATHNGMLFGSDDAGDTWVKYPREFTEVRAICWVPL